MSEMGRMQSFAVTRNERWEEQPDNLKADASFRTIKVENSAKGEGGPKVRPLFEHVADELPQRDEQLSEAPEQHYAGGHM